MPELELTDYFVPKDWQQITAADLDMGSTSPVWFTFGKLNLLAGGGKRGRLSHGRRRPWRARPPNAIVYDARSRKRKSQFQGQGIWGGLSYWKDSKNQDWIYVPIWGPQSSHSPEFPMTNGPTPHGSILAFKVVLDSESGNPVLKPAWTSGDLNLPEPPIIANGVLFALSTGENAIQTSDRFKNIHPAKLYALDASTGKVLYQSENSFNTWVHFSGLAISNGRVYAVDHDSWVYCFGEKEK